MERRMLVGSLLLGAALLAAAAAVWVAVDREASAPELKPRIEAGASRFLGRPLTIGSLEWRRWPEAVLIGHDVRLYDDAAKTELAVEDPVVEARLALLPLFKADAGVSELRFVGPRVYLRRARDGSWNAVRIVEEIIARPDEPVRSWGQLVFNWFVIEGGTATVTDEAGGLGGAPPLPVEGRGKLRFGRHHTHFPFRLGVRLAGAPTAAELSGDLGGSHAALRVDVKDGRAALARLVWPGAERWTGRWEGGLSWSAGTGEWDFGARASGLALSTAAARFDALEGRASRSASGSWTFTGVARSSATEVALKGAAGRGALTLDVASPRADCADLRGWLGAAAPDGAPRAAGPARPPRRLTARLALERLSCGKLEARNVRAVVSRSTGPYTLDRLTLDALGGTVAAQGSYRPSASSDSLKIAWQTADVQAQDLFRLAGSTLEASGTADTSGSLATAAGPLFLPKLSGEVRLDLRNGWLGDEPALLRVLSKLNLVSLFGKDGRTRMPFDEARGAVRIKDGRAETEEPIVLQNKTLQLVLLGRCDLAARTLDGRVAVNFLTVTDEIIRLIPGVNAILLGDQKGLLPIWLEVKGPAADPRVRVLPGKSIAGPVWNTLKRLLRLPQALVDKASSR
jgi:hypothetical protein